MAHEVATKSLGVAGRCGGNAGSRTRGALSGSFTSLISEDKPFRYGSLGASISKRGN
jgi:hypothetical protein